MELIELNADLRTKTGKGEAHKLRREGKIPAIYYGKSQENLMLAVDPRMLEKVVGTTAGMNAILRLKVQGKGDYNVLLRDYQAHTITRKFTHADFVHVDLTKKIQVAIPVHLTGNPIGVKEGGILQQATREIQILCLPTNIPKEVVADVSGLKIGQNLHLHDLKLPEGAESVGEVDVTIASIIAVKEEEVLTPGVMTEPEVLTAKKEEGAEGAAAADGKAAASAKGAPAKAAPAKAAPAAEKKEGKK